MEFGPSAEATFVAGDVGREGCLALWGEPETSAAPADVAVELLLRDGLASVPCSLVPVADLIGPLAALPADTDVRPSVRAWSVATRLALDLVSRGRLLPAASASGHDTWRVGPLDLDDRARLEQLAAALPPEAHAVPLGPDHVLSPDAAVTAYVDSVADSFVRTPAAPMQAGGDPYAAPGRTNVSAVESWLHSVTAGTGGAGPTIVSATFLLLATDVAMYVDGKLIEKPVLRSQYRILAIAERLQQQRRQV